MFSAILSPTSPLLEFYWVPPSCSRRETHVLTNVVPSVSAIIWRFPEAKYLARANKLR